MQAVKWVFQRPGESPKRKRHKKDAKESNLPGLNKPEDPPAGTATPDPGCVSYLCPRLTSKPNQEKREHNRIAAISICTNSAWLLPPTQQKHIRAKAKPNKPKPTQYKTLSKKFCANTWAYQSQSKMLRENGKRKSNKETNLNRLKKRDDLTVSSTTPMAR